MDIKSEQEGQGAVAQSMPTRKLLAIAGLVLAAFLSSYNYAVARNADPAGSGLLAAAAAGLEQVAGAGCCGGGGPAVEGSTVVEGGVQTIAVDTSTGSFSPNVIRAKAGVPIELAFSQAPGGCLSGVYFPDFNIDEDLTSGGRTVTLPALEKGEYQFFCQMQMVSATIVVE